MSAVVDIAKELMATVGRLSSLETRTADVARQQERIESKLDLLIDRLARMEANYTHLKDNLKNEVMSDIGRELTKVQVILDLQFKGLLPNGLVLGGEHHAAGKARSASETGK